MSRYNIATSLVQFLNRFMFGSIKAHNVFK